MEEIPREDIDSLKRGDVLTVTTREDGESIRPQVKGKNIEDPIATNQFNGAKWIVVEGAMVDGRTYEVVIKRSTPKKIIAEKIQSSDFYHTVKREERDEVSIENSRKEAIDWDGTPQSREEAKTKDVTSEDDIRGNKNDLLGGNL